MKRTRAGTVMTTWPEGFAVSPAIAKMCRDEGLPNPYDVIRDFESSARAKAYRYADWEAAFRKWMRSDITRKDYPPWEPPNEPEAQPTLNYGPAVAFADLPKSQQEQIARLGGSVGLPVSKLLSQVVEDDAKVGANVRWEPKPKPAGGDA